MCSFTRFCIALLFYVGYVWSQSVHVVTVGEHGSFYEPPFVSVAKGDIVSFTWLGTQHSVTQSSFDNPCTPLEGGFDSGVTGNPSTSDLVIPVWNLTITNVSEPIWFFCKMTDPEPHCTQGMVGAINILPTGANNSYDKFLLKAKTLANPPVLPRVPPSITGIGAAATTIPLPTKPTATTSTPASVTTTSSSSTLSPETSATDAPQNAPQALSASAKGGIAGGIIAAVLITLIVVLAVLSYLRARRYRRQAMVVNQALKEKEAEHDYVNITRMPRRKGGDATSTSESEVDGSAAPSGLNIKELAIEIAKNMQHDSDGGPGASRSLQNLNAVSESGTMEPPRTRQVRNLPRIPNQVPGSRETSISADTLPAYKRSYG